MKQPEVLVVGAGIFGVWTAFELQRSGFSVRLVDAWGVAHSRASSSGESRVIRIGYGDRKLYSEWAAYSLERWKQLEKELELTLFIETGFVWLGVEEDARLDAIEGILGELRTPFEIWTSGELVRRFPALSPDRIQRVIWEPESGVLLARYACRQVARQVIQQGGSFRFGAVRRPDSDGPRLNEVEFNVGSRVSADYFVFACGPWMGEVFPELLGSRISITRQGIFFFGMPPGDQSYLPGRLPAWIDLTGSRDYYGLPAVGGRSLKMACDASGPNFDPTDGERVPDPAELEAIRAYRDHRFPGLKKGPLLESRVCQYSRSPDSHLIIDRHPAWENVILAGAGSGHGFKLGPAVGRQVRKLIEDPEAKPPSEVALD